MSDEQAPERDVTREPERAPEPEARRRRRSWRRWWPPRRWLPRRLRRYSRGTVIVLVALVAAGVVSAVTIDLGPGLRARAEQAFASRIDRPVHIGRLGTYLLPGRFLIEDLVIEGLSSDDRPFFHGERIVISTSWLPLLQGEFLVTDVEMQGWRMLVENFGDDQHSFPRFAGGPDDEPPPPADVTPAEPEPAADAAEGDADRFVTTVQYLRAHDGEFIFEDHGAPWSVVARNIDLTITKGVAYGGQVSFSDGTVRIADFEPMTADMEAIYELDSGQVDLPRIDLRLDGFESVLTGAVDLLNWPEQTYDIVGSTIDLPTMKDVFFADDEFAVTGDATFRGLWHLFDGGRELTGSFASGNAALNGLDFPALDGDLIWTRDRFEITRARSGFYGGDLDFTFSMKPLGAPTPGIGTFDASWARVDLDPLLETLEIRGARPDGYASGRNLLRWPLGQGDLLSGDGHVVVSPEAGTPLLPRGVRPSAGRSGWAYAGRALEPGAGVWRFPLGGELAYQYGPEKIELEPSWMATPLTAIEFEGETAWGEQSRIPFHVVSADWQESDRLMAAIMTAFGRATGDVAVGGHGEMNGVMLGALLSPRIEARFDGDAITAWNVAWGHGSGDIVVENGSLDVFGGLFRDGASELEVDGRFALGGPRPDGGDEIDARFGLVALPAQHMRDAFSLEGYPIDGPLDGEIHLFGAYRRPFGFGGMTLGSGVAYGEPFDEATAGMRFEGDGVWLDGLSVRKGGGEVTGAMFIRWDGTYSVNADGRDIALETVRVIEQPRTPVSGLLRFTVAGAGAFEEPRYEVDGTITDLTVADALVGQVTGRLEVRNDLMLLEVEAASPSLAVSGSGRVGLTADAEAELQFRFTNTTLDPFVRTFAPRLPEATSAIVSGTLEVEGPVRNIDQLHVDGTVEQLDLTLFDYPVTNDGPVRLSLDQNVVRVDRMLLEGEGTELELTGEIDLTDERLALRADGDANLGILQGFFPDIRSAGDTRLAARIGGSLGEPVITGEVTVDGGRLRHFSLPHSLDAISGRLVFEPSGIRFDDLTAEFGGGPVRFGGRLGLRGYELGDLDITATGTEMRLRYEGVRSLVDAELTLRGSVDDPTLGGTVNVRDAILLELFEPSTGLIDFTADRPSPVAPPADVTLPLRFDLHIVAPSSLRISDNNTQIVLSADLTLRGTYDQPLLFGNAEIERGQAYFEGNRYRVTRGSIGFANPTEIEPFIDVELETDRRVPGQTYRVALGVSGTMERLVFELSSDPPLSEFEIMGLLLGDVRDPQAAEIRALRAAEASRRELFQAGAARLLTGPLSSGVGGVIERSFGVDTFEITPSLDDPVAQQSTQLIPTARVLIGQRISDRAHITFSRALSGSNQDLIVILEYDASDRLSWVLSQNEDRTYALEFRVRHAF